MIAFVINKLIYVRIIIRVIKKDLKYFKKLIFYLSNVTLLQSFKSQSHIGIQFILFFSQLYAFVLHTVPTHMAPRQLRINHLLYCKIMKYHPWMLLSMYRSISRNFYQVKK